MKKLTAKREGKLLQLLAERLWPVTVDQMSKFTSEHLDFHDDTLSITIERDFTVPKMSDKKRKALMEFLKADYLEAKEWQSPGIGYGPIYHLSITAR